MTLSEYRKKRDFDISPEQSGDPNEKESRQLSGIYVIQKHRASQLHYDFRLEWNGTLLSWAVPKGPSLDPSTKRLAMQVEDHSVEYAKFEGVIPEGEYGSGTVMVWDTGTWTSEVPDVAAALRKGDLKFTLHGKKLKGSWVLVETHGYGSSSKRAWLLIKLRDEFASGTRSITEEMPRSAVSNLLLSEIAREHGGDVTKAANGDPAGKRANGVKVQPASKSTNGTKRIPTAGRSQAQKRKRLNKS